VYELLSYVVRGKVRLKVLKILRRPKTPTEIAQTLKIHRPSVSRAIIALKKKGLIVCLTPKEKKGRLYVVSELGQRVLRMLEEEDDET